MLRTTLALVAAALSLLGPSTIFAQEPARRDLTGTVSDESGIAIAHATVRTWQAWPIHGISYYCPGCYADCGKLVQADEDGRWCITSVDASLQFTVLATAEGFIPAITRKHDPADGPLHITLKRRDASLLRPAQVVRGRVLGSDGNPLEGAVVEPEMVWWGGWKSGSGGAVAGLDPMAVTNDKGEFALAYKDDCDGMDLRVEAPAHAQALFKRTASGTEARDLRLVFGVTIRGRLVKDGEPAHGIEVGVCSVDRSSDANFERHTIGTGVTGKFEFANLNPGRDYVVYPLMDSARKLGSGVPRRVHAGADKSTADAGDLALAPGHRVAGRVQMPAGASLALPAKVMLSGELAWDSQAVDVKPDGTFELSEVPTGVYELNVIMKGFEPSERNASFCGAQRLMGKVDRDIDLVCLMSPAGTSGRSGITSTEAPLRGYEDAIPAQPPAPK
jgi:hypothetical protein